MNSLIPLHVLKSIVTQCSTAIITADANVVLNLLIHPFECATVNSILTSTVNTKAGIIALYSSFLWNTSTVTEVSNNLHELRNIGLIFKCVVGALLSVL